MSQNIFSQNMKNIAMWCISIFLCYGLTTLDVLSAGGETSSAKTAVVEQSKKNKRKPARRMANVDTHTLDLLRAKLSEKVLDLHEREHDGRLSLLSDQCDYFNFVEIIRFIKWEDCKTESDLAARAIECLKHMAAKKVSFEDVVQIVHDIESFSNYFVRRAPQAGLVDFRHYIEYKVLLAIDRYYYRYHQEEAVAPSQSTFNIAQAVHECFIEALQEMDEEGCQNHRALYQEDLELPELDTFLKEKKYEVEQPTLHIFANRICHGFISEAVRRATMDNDLCVLHKWSAHIMKREGSKCDELTVPGKFELKSGVGCGGRYLVFHNLLMFLSGEHARLSLLNSIAGPRNFEKMTQFFHTKNSVKNKCQYADGSCRGPVVFEHMLYERLSAAYGAYIAQEKDGAAVQATANELKRVSYFAVANGMDLSLNRKRLIHQFYLKYNSNSEDESDSGSNSEDESDSGIA